MAGRVGPSRAVFVPAAQKFSIPKSQQVNCAGLHQARLVALAFLPASPHPMRRQECQRYTAQVSYRQFELDAPL